MNQDEITQLVENLLRNSQAGMEVESPKIDFKRNWYKLNTAAGINEFLKDSSAIVNTVGPDGFIIIGFDEKTKTFHKASFKKSRLRDTSNLNNLITKGISYPFDITVYDVIIDDNMISIIHIPPSIEKPHVIKLYKKIKGRNTKSYQNIIFI